MSFHFYELETILTVCYWEHKSLNQVRLFYSRHAGTWLGDSFILQMSNWS